MAVTNVRKRAMAAASALLGLGAATSQAADPKQGSHWTIDTSFLRYSEAERIKVVEPQIGLRKEFAGDKSLSLLFTFDSITGSTPLGTLPETQNTAPNTVTNASGRAYNPIIGKVPLAEMEDTRVALDASWQQPLSTNLTGVFGGYVSKETDFLALGTSVKLARDFNQKNTTFSLGLGPEFDFIDPNGGKPASLATVGDPNSLSNKVEHRALLSGVAGITQVINRKTLMQFNYGLTYEEGYLNDPYKQLSVVDDQGDPVRAIYESRPGDRVEHIFYWLTRWNMVGKDVFSLGLRYYTDDWGIESSTLDFTYRRQSHPRFYWEPHVRYYHQTESNFFKVGLRDGLAYPDHATSDMRQADLRGVTIGLRMGYTLKNKSELIVRAEYYTQTGENNPPEAIGAQRAYDLFPTLRASIIQVEYRFEPATLFNRK